VSRNYGTLRFHGRRTSPPPGVSAYKWKSFDEWIIDAEPHVMMRIRRVFKRGQAVGRIHLKATDEVARDLLWICERWPLECPDIDRLRADAARHDRITTEFQAVLSGQIAPRRFDLAVPAREYQQTAADLFLRVRSLLLADDVGLGKTATSICALTDPSTRPALVVTLTHLPTQWVRELQKFAPGLRAHVVKSGQPYDVARAMSGRRGKKAQEAGQADLFAPEFPDVLVINYHKLAGWADTLAGKMRTVIFDEVQELRKSGSYKSDAAIQIAEGATYRLGLSATPIYNYGGEFWQVFQALNPGALGTVGEFTNEWCVSAGDIDKARIKDPAAFGTYLRDAGLMLRRTRHDVARELPALSKIVQVIDTDEKALDEVADAAAALARVLLARESGWQQRGEAARELDWRLRQATGVAKAVHVADFVRLLVESGERVVLYGWHRECFARGTRVLMHDGATKPVEEVEAGDVVMGPDSRPRRVLSLVRGRGAMLRVVPKKGESWVCSANHTLALHCGAKNRRPHVRMTASNFAGLSPRAQRDLSLYRAGEVQFGAQPDPLEPWLLGYWLGDGASNLAGGLRVSSADPEVAHEVEVIAQRYGLTIASYACKRGTTPCRFYAFSSGRAGGAWGRNPLLSLLKGHGLHKNKHIPQAYKTASPEARRQLLAGLIDSDGYVYDGTSAGTADFTNKNETLARDVAFVARSVGLAAYVRSTVRRTALNDGPAKYYIVSISGDLTTLPMRIARKAAPARRQRKSVLRTGFAVEPAGDDDFFGFEVDGDHLFLLDDFTVVHNCYSIWLDRLKDLSPVMFTGSESPTQKEAARAAFIEGKAQVLIMSLRAGAGLDGLQAVSRTVVFGELDWSPGVHEQATGRVHRDGQADPVMAYYLVADEGSDPVVAEVLGVKKQQIEGVRDPSGTPVVTADGREDALKQLARAYLDRPRAPAQAQESVA